MFPLAQEKKKPRKTVKIVGGGTTGIGGEKCRKGEVGKKVADQTDRQTKASASGDVDVDGGSVLRCCRLLSKSMMPISVAS